MSAVAPSTTVNANAEQAWYSPFLSLQYCKLFASNVGEYCGYIVSDLALNLAIYEYYRGDSPQTANLALGLIGVLNLLIQLPSIPLGGVLADDLRRTAVVAVSQAVQAATNALAAYLCLRRCLHPALIYCISAATTFARVVEKSARGALTANCVHRAALSHASAINVISADFGEVVAPFIFILLSTVTTVTTVTTDTTDTTVTTVTTVTTDTTDTTVTTGGNSVIGANTSVEEDQASLAMAFFAAALFHVFSGVLAAGIVPYPLSAEQEEAARRAERRKEKRGEGAVRHRIRMMMEGLRYILAHPLLPGLYLLDWGMTLVTFYRELFPMFVAQLWTDHLRYHLSFRQTVSLLTATNFLGGITGGVFTFYTGKVEKRKGRTVVIATLFYGAASIAFGLNKHLLFAFPIVFLCGALDAVGASTRKQIIVITVVDEMLGRAASGGSFAALVANSIGQIYVAAMSSLIGPGKSAITVLFAIPKRSIPCQFDDNDVNLL